MIAVRASGQRGQADYGWLRARYSFSFADYLDPSETGWGALCVINEDLVAPGQGFPMHGHRDMEILTLVLSGVLEHRDSLGNGALIRPGEIQRMSAGTGVRHSEFNPSTEEATHLLQIWIRPRTADGAPDYEQMAFPVREGATLLASPDGRDGSVRIGQEATLTRVRLAAGEEFIASLAQGRLGYAHTIAGSLTATAVSGRYAISAGDGLKVVDEAAVSLVADTATEVPVNLLWFDLPA